MAGLLLIEGFETFGANGDTGSSLQDIMLKKLSNVSAATSAKLSDSAYEGQGLCFDFVSSGTSYKLVHTHDPVSSELIVGFAWNSGSRSANGYLYRALNPGVNYYSGVMSLYTKTDGGFTVYYASGSKATATGLIAPNTWYYIEIKWKVADSPNGYWKLYLDGTLIESEIGIDTSSVPTYSDNAYGHLWTPWSNTNVKIDDIYVYDNTGDVQEPFGPVKVRVLLPDGDDITDWTSTGANHYDQVNNIPVDTANYVESDTANDVDLFTFANALDASTWPVLGVQLNVHAAVTDVGYFTLEGIADSNGTQATANETFGDNLGGNYRFVFEDDPETSNAWTIDKLNAAKFGVGVE